MISNIVSLHFAEQPSIRYHDIEIHPSRGLVLFRGQRVHVPKQEMVILYHLVDGGGRIRTREFFVDNFFEEERFYDWRNVDSSIKRIRIAFRKVFPDFASIGTVYGMGYQWVAPIGERVVKIGDGQMAEAA